MTAERRTRSNASLASVGFAGGATTIAFWLLGYGYPELMATAPTGLESAFTAVLSTLALGVREVVQALIWKRRGR